MTGGGGREGKGPNWVIGTCLHSSQLVALLEQVEGKQQVDNKHLAMLVYKLVYIQTFSIPVLSMLKTDTRLYFKYA